MEWEMNFKWGGIYLKRSSVHILYISPQCSGSVAPCTPPHDTCPAPTLRVSQSPALSPREVAAVTRPPAALHALLTTTATHLTRTWVGAATRHLATSPPGLSLQSMVASVVINIVINMQTPDQPDSDHAL